MKKFSIIFKDTDYFFCTILFPLIIIFLLFLKILNRYFILRFLEIRSDRIGHFSIMPELYLTRKEILKKKYELDIFCLQKTVCNNFLKKKWKNKMLILPRVFIFPIFFWLKKFNMKKNIVSREEFFAKDINNYLDFSQSNIVFSKSEKFTGELILKKLGLNAAEKYVCFTVRDNEYLKKNSNYDNSYHNYRNTSLINFKKVSDYLNSKNIKVVRMGSVAQEKVKFASNNVIDYSFSNLRSDFMDFFLVANCYFYIGGGPGVDALPVVLRKPKLQTNLVPILGMTCEVRQVMTIFKHHYSIELKRNLSIKEIIEYNLDNLHHTKLFNEKKIKLIENSPEEILYATKDLMNLIENENSFLKKNKNAEQDLFWSLFPIKKKNESNIPLHGKVRGFISPSFLNNNKYLLN